MSLDVGMAGLPGLQVQIDFQAGLVLVRVRDLDDDGVVAVRAGLAIGAPQELEELLTGFWVHLDPHIPPRLTVGDFQPFVEYA